MKRYELIIVLALLTVLVVAIMACGEIKVKGSVDEETIDAIGDALDTSTESDTDTDTITNSEPETEEETADDVTGGIEYFSESEKGTDRFFIGTYAVDDWYTTCDDAYWGPGLEVPAVLRAYSYRDFVDFETSFSELVWTAVIYPDDSMDFQIRYLDNLGRPSINLVCTCSFSTDSWDQTFNCTCDVTDYGSCNLYYNEM